MIFLVERYGYFALSDGQVYLTRVYHAPWILDEAVLTSHHSSMLGALALPEPASAPLVHFSRHQSAEIWAPAAVK